MPRMNINSDWLAVRNIKNLRNEMRNLGFSASFLAQSIGVSNATIHDIANGKYPCSILHYNALAHIFKWQPFSSMRPLHKDQQQLSIDIPQDVENQHENKPNQAKKTLDTPATYKKDVTIRIPLQDYEEVKKIANGNPISPVITQAIRFFLAARNNFSEAHLDH